MEKFYIFGTIGGWGVYAEDIQYFLGRNRGKDVEIMINSPGGYISEGVAIYNLLRQHTGKVKTTILGQAASIASVILLAGEEREALTGSYVMIHEPGFNDFYGYLTAEDLRKGAETLDALKESILEIYVERTGKTREELEPLIKAETWMTSEVAKDLNFITKTTDSNLAAVACVRHNLSNFKNVPEDLRRGEARNNPSPVNPQTERSNQPTKEPEMDLSKATLEDVKRDNPELYAQISTSAVNDKRGEISAQATEAELNRVKGLDGLMEMAKDAPQAVTLAVRNAIDEARKDPKATAENTAPKLVGVMAKAYTQSSKETGKGARELGNAARQLPSGENNTPEVTEEAAKKAKVSGIASGFKNKR